MVSQDLEHEGKSLMDVAVNRQGLLVLPSINLVQIKGLILYMIKAVLNGKGEKVVDLARTKLFM